MCSQKDKWTMWSQMDHVVTNGPCGHKWTMWSRILGVLATAKVCKITPVRTTCSTMQHYLESLKLKSVNKRRIIKCSCVVFYRKVAAKVVPSKVTRGSWQKPSSRPSKCRLLMKMTLGKFIRATTRRLVFI